MHFRLFFWPCSKLVKNLAHACALGEYMLKEANAGNTCEFQAAQKSKNLVTLSSVELVTMYEHIPTCPEKAESDKKTALAEGWDQQEEDHPRASKACSCSCFFFGHTLRPQSRIVEYSSSWMAQRTYAFRVGTQRACALEERMSNVQCRI